MDTMDNSNRCSEVLTKLWTVLLESAKALAQQMMAGTPTHDPMSMSMPGRRVAGPF